MEWLVRQSRPSPARTPVFDTRPLVPPGYPAPPDSLYNPPLLPTLAPDYEGHPHAPIRPRRRRTARRLALHRLRPPRRGFLPHPHGPYRSVVCRLRRDSPPTLPP